MDKELVESFVEVIYFNTLALRNKLKTSYNAKSLKTVIDSISYDINIIKTMIDMEENNE